MDTLEKDLVGDSLREIEEKHDLLKYKVDGWCIWHFFRSAVGEDLTFKVEPLRKKKEVPFLKRIMLAIKGLPVLLFPGRASYLVITCSSDRSEIENAKRKNIIFDDLLKELDDYFIVESVNNKSFVFSAKDVLIKSNMTAEIFLLLAFSLSKLYIPRSIRKLADELSKIIRDEFELPQYTSGLVADWCMYFHWLKKLYKWLIKRVHPEIILIGSGGASYIFAAAKELHIKVVEFQHGIQSFTPWSKYAISYKQFLPNPSYIFLLNDIVKIELMHYGFWNDNELCPVGSMRIDEYRDKKERLKREHASKCQIILTTGTGSQLLIEFILKFLHLIKDKLDLELIIKTHPAYETDGVLYLQAFRSDKRVRVVLGNEQPSTFELLIHANIHLSVCSSCHYDSISLGIPTVILGLPCHEMFLPLYKKGHALLANTPEELVEIVSHYDSYNVPRDVNNLYYKYGALNKIKSELRKIMNKPLSSSN